MRRNDRSTSGPTSQTCRQEKAYGAGKTTTVRILATLLAPDGGQARVLGHDVMMQAGAVRRRIALTGQFATVDDDLSGRENLVLLGRLAGLARRARHHESRQPGEHIMTEVTTGSAAAGQALRLGLPAGPRPEPPGALSASAASGWRALAVTGPEHSGPCEPEPAAIQLRPQPLHLGVHVIDRRTDLFAPAGYGPAEQQRYPLSRSHHRLQRAIGSRE